MNTFNTEQDCANTAIINYNHITKGPLDSFAPQMSKFETKLKNLKKRKFMAIADLDAYIRGEDSNDYTSEHELSLNFEQCQVPIKECQLNQNSEEVEFSLKEEFFSVDNDSDSSNDMTIVLV